MSRTFICVHVSCVGMHWRVTGKAEPEMQGFMRDTRGQRHKPRTCGELPALAWGAGETLVGVVRAVQLQGAHAQQDVLQEVVHHDQAVAVPQSQPGYSRKRKSALI